MVLWPSGRAGGRAEEGTVIVLRNEARSGARRVNEDVRHVRKLQRTLSGPTRLRATLSRIAWLAGLLFVCLFVPSVGLRLRCGEDESGKPCGCIRRSA